MTETTTDWAHRVCRPLVLVWLLLSPSWLGADDSRDVRRPDVPRMPALDLEALDRDADPCRDFYRFACGGWHEANPMPPSETFWSKPFTQFARQVDEYVREMVAEAAQASGDFGPDARILGDFYSACMDEATIDDRGLQPLEMELAVLDRLESIKDLGPVLGSLHRHLSWSPQATEPLFFVGALWDAEAGETLLRIGPSGLGLGSPDYYLENEHAGLLVAYREHVAEIFEILGEDAPKASRKASAVVELESQLAAGQLPKAVTRNDPSATRNSMSASELQDLTPHLQWAGFFREHGLPETTRVSVKDPGYLRALNEVLSTTDVATWRAYLRWQIAAERTAVLPRSLRQARFSFFGRRLHGQQEPPERSRTCFHLLENNLPTFLGRLFVSGAFDPEMRHETLRAFDAIRRVTGERFRRADWLSPAAQAEALAKLDAMRISVGHPETWLDEARLVVRRDDAYGNVRRAGHGFRRVGLSRIGRPHDVNWWDLPVTWMGGYYETDSNAIVITAAMLLLYESGLDDPAVLFGGLGAFLAHEVMHGFDPTGSQLDASGRVRTWWTEQDASAYSARTACLAEQFSEQEYAPGIPISGEFVVSEQFAELAALDIAWDAFQTAVESTDPNSSSGLTAPQRLLVTQAQTWCAEATDGTWQSMAAGSSSKAWAGPMVNGTVRNVPWFAEAFGCSDDSPMVLSDEERCETW